MTITTQITQEAISGGKAEIAKQVGTYVTSYPLLGFFLTHWIITLIIGLFLTIYIKSKVTAMIEATGDFLLKWTGRAAIITTILFLIKDVILR